MEGRKRRELTSALVRGLTGLANNCHDVDGVCNGEPKLPGLWEIPM